MEKFKLIAICLFGLESLVSNEIKKIGYEVEKVEDGKITFIGGYDAICKANLWVRTAERILIKVGEFKAFSFEELFENTSKINWEDWINVNDKFPVKGYSLKSKLYSVPDCQSIIKKAVVETLKKKYKTDWFKEEEALYQIQFSILKDKVTLMIDTTGEGLHKRGYRAIGNEAPLRETLAAGIISLSFWNHERLLLDPFCGSGTIPIEAALIGLNIPPGLQRDFTFTTWNQIKNSLWKNIRKESYDLINYDNDLEIVGYDINHKNVELSKHNATKAGISDSVMFSHNDALKIKHDSQYGCIITNPPYGERMGEKKEVEKLYKDMSQVFSRFETWSKYILTSHDQFEDIYGKKAHKRRKLYNGMLKCTLYQYFGPRPPRK